jgi:hypothetical protein
MMSKGVNCTHCDRNRGLINITGINHEAIKEVFKLVDAVQEAFSYRGMRSVTEEGRTHIPQDRLKEQGTQDPTDFPLDTGIIDELGKEIANKVGTELMGRTFETSKREKRFAPVVAKVGLKLGSTLAKSLFLPKNGILNRILSLGFKNLAPVANFASTGSKLSWLSNLMKSSFQSIAEGESKTLASYQAWTESHHEARISDIERAEFHSDSAIMNKVMELSISDGRLQSELDSVEEDFAEVHLQIGDIVNAMFTMFSQTIQLNAMATCRDGSIPITILSPSLLTEKLIDLSKRLDEDLEMVIRVTEVQRYYTLKMSSCFWDSDGGIIETTIPLKRKDESWRLFELRSISYQWKEYTCDLGIDAGYFAFELKTKSVHPISPLSSEACRPKSTGLCQVPMVTTVICMSHNKEITITCLHNYFPFARMEMLRSKTTIV